MWQFGFARLNLMLSLFGEKKKFQFLSWDGRPKWEKTYPFFLEKTLVAKMATKAKTLVAKRKI